MSELAQILDRAIGDRSIGAVAEEWGINPWTLRDIQRGHTKRPRNPDVLMAISRGSGIAFEVLIVAAYRPNGERPAPPPT